MNPSGMSLLDQLIQPEIDLLNQSVPVEYADPTFLPIHLSGGIGDVIMAMDAIKLLREEFLVVVYTKHVDTFEYFSQGDVPVFSKLPNFLWHLEIDTISKFHFKNGFHGFLLAEDEELFNRQQSLFKTNFILEKIVSGIGNKFFLISNYAKNVGWDRREFPLRCLGYGKVPFKKMGTLRYDQITIHDGFDTSYSSTVHGRSTKTWNWNAWNKLVQMIKREFPKTQIVQLGSTTSRLIDGVDSCLVNKLTITESFDVLKHSKIHIDGDSGLVHAATRMSVPCIVLWGPTPDSFYGYPENVNLKAGNCHGCYGLTETWNAKCPVGYSTPICMDEISPEQVFEQVKIKLEETK